ncbi:MAG: HDOD domain-containing protein [Candidatus Solibacter sp.]
MDHLAESQTPRALSLLPPFPAIAHKILALAGHDDSSAPEVGRLIRLDPTFSAELLRCANSALFGVRRQVSSLTQAVALLGMERVKSMATFVAVNHMVRSSKHAPALRKIWVHCVVTAIIMDEAARLCGLERDSAYTTGLLHNLGALGLMSAYPDEYPQVLEDAGGGAIDVLCAERARFEIDHCTAGAHLAKEWQFPKELQDAIATHHEDPAPHRGRLAELLRICRRLTDTLGYAASAATSTWPLAELTALLPHSPDSWLCGTAEAARAQIDAKLADSPL